MLIAGNWKMNKTHHEAVELARAVADKSASLTDGPDLDVAVCPPFVFLDAVGAAIEGSGVLLGAQNMHQEDEGAFTGEVSGRMLRSVGCSLVILGHSERRQYHHESDENIHRKSITARAAGLRPIVCVGEQLSERKKGKEKEVVERQLEGALNGLDIDENWMPVVAYEPVWAIGTGETATPQQAQEMHLFIRSRLTELAGAELARKIQILYGGSMKPANALDLLTQPDIDGGLIGGASLKADDFHGIVLAAIEAGKS